MQAITPKIAILLSTYNGERFLAEQLKSLQNQTMADWVLYIRDDGSTDKTITIIQDFIQHDSRMILLNDTLGNLKPCHSFAVLLAYYWQHTTIPLVFFCDQDDVWLKDKLALQYAELIKHKTPALVFSDLTVTNADLKSIHHSFLEYEHYTGTNEQPLNTLLIHNYITGCTIGMNRALVSKVYPIPEQAIMHDWWCALVAAACGTIIFIPKPLVLYRQHSHNQIGANHSITKFKRVLFRWTKIKTAFLQRFSQAQILAERFDQPVMIHHFAQLLKQKRIQRLMTSIRLKLRPMGWMRRLHYYVLLITR